MKHLILTLICIPILAISQKEIIDLGINGKDLTTIGWLNSSLTLKVSSGVSAYKPRGKDVVIKTIDLVNGTFLNTYKSEKGIDVNKYNQYGNYIVSGSLGAVSTIFDGLKDGRVIGMGGEVLGEIDKLGSKEIHWDNGTIGSFLTKDYLIEIGPKEKGYKNTKKLDKKNPIEWLLYKFDLKTLEEKLIPINLNGLSGKEYAIGYTFLAYSDDNIYLLSKEFSNTNEGKYPDNQSLIITILDLDGNILENKKLDISIDNSKYHFAYAALKGGQATKIVNSAATSNNISVRVPRSQATGTIYIDNKNKFYYVISILSGNKGNNGAWVLTAKFNFSGDKLWENIHKFMDKTPSNKNMKYISCDPRITDNFLYFIEVNQASNKSFKEISSFSMVTNSGVIVNEREFEKIDGIFKRGETWHNLVTGKYLKNELSKKIVLSDNTLMAYSLNDKLKDYLTNLNIDRETFFYSHYTMNGDLYLLQANYKDQVYKLLKFNHNSK
ncbi:MAG: hypothetical protein IIB06_03300 [Bacteroidetes bacterium]|nr:hypothetical protein [Bacteroidota bacterium]